MEVYKNLIKLPTEQSNEY